MSSKKAAYAILFVFILCVVLTVMLVLQNTETAVAQIYSDGQLVKTVPLSKDTSFVLPSAGGGTNTIEIRDGKIAVTEASCPDHVCISFGWCSSGMPIVCLPNRLIIEFPGGENYDNISG